MDHYVGRYGPAGTPGIAIAVGGGWLWFRMPGAPASTDVALEPIASDSFRVMAGRLAGGTLTFERDTRGDVIAVALAGSMRLPRQRDDAAPDYALGPEPADDPRVLADLSQFSELLRRAYPWIDLQLGESARGEATLRLAGSSGLRDAFDADLRHALEAQR